MAEPRPGQSKPQTSQFRCEFCGRSFKSLDQLRQHEADCYGDELEKQI